MSAYKKCLASAFQTYIISLYIFSDKVIPVLTLNKNDEETKYDNIFAMLWLLEVFGYSHHYEPNHKVSEQN